MRPHFYLEVIFILYSTIFFVFILFFVIIYYRNKQNISFGNIKIHRKNCIYKIALFICGMFFIIVGVVFFFISIENIKNGWIVFFVEVGCIINSILFFALSDIAQKVNDIYKKN